MAKKSLWMLKLFLFFAMSISSMVVGFLPLYFQEKGLSSSEIGMFLALGTLVGLIAQPIWGVVSDKFKTVKKVLVVSVLGVLLGIIWLFQMESLLWIFIAGTFFYMFNTAINPLSDNLAKKTATQFNVSFGSIRSWSSIGFAVVSLGSGFFFTKYGLGYFSIPMIAFAVIAFILALNLRDVDSGGRKFNMRDVGLLFKNRTLMLFFVITSFITITHRVNDSFVSLYLFDIGGNEMLVGWLWFIAVASEAIALLFSAVWFRSEHPIRYLIFVSALFGVRWLMTGFIDSPMMLLTIQVLHGISFAVLFLAAIEYLYNAVPEGVQATGHMVFMGITFMITGIIGSSVGGFIFDHYGGPTLYFTLSVSSFIGMIGFIYFYYREKGKNQATFAKG